jgi:hypothetical protein
MNSRNLKFSFERLKEALINKEYYETYKHHLSKDHFKRRKYENSERIIRTQLSQLQDSIWGIIKLGDNVPDARKNVLRIVENIKALAKLYNQSKTRSMLALIEETVPLIPRETTNLNISIPSNLPPEIKEEVVADLQEMMRCYDSGCLRSAVILCGRILEIALQRKYYDATGIDILEKSPGIGLGKLIAKLTEKKVPLDPGLTQQIHLVNQVRVFSVHKKQSVFYPSKAQTQAIILYTTDILWKLFS